ncbi:MAG: hypothetical protein O2885_03620, partial [Proteobacteria bacterium]|nr:hypothetical protein [Pseudomonadota bacterium]
LSVDGLQLSSTSATLTSGSSISGTAATLYGSGTLTVGSTSCALSTSVLSYPGCSTDSGSSSTPVATTTPEVTTPEVTTPEVTTPEVTTPISVGEVKEIEGGGKVEVIANEDGTESTKLTLGGVEVVVTAPAGAAKEIAPGGIVKVTFIAPGGVTAAETAKPDGTKISVVTVGGKSTQFEALVGATTKINADGSMESTKAVGNVEQKMVIRSDGNMEAELKLEGVATPTKAVLPPGTEAKPTESGAIKLTSPVTLPGGGEVSISTGLNKSGQAIIKIPKVGDAKPVALPKTPPGAAVEIVGTTITITTPLGETVDATGRSTAAASAAETFVGRTTTGAEVLVYNQSSDAKFSFSRDLSAAESTTTITLVTGTARIKQGGVDTEMTLNSGYSITNDAIELSLAAKSNYVSLPANVALSTADLELDLGDVHSVWVWNTNTPGWEAFSADSATSALLDNASIVSLSDGVEVADGMFVYSTTAQDVAIADGRDLSISSVLASRSAPSNGWYLLAVGNQNDTASGIATLNSNIQTIWVPDGTSWKVYSSNAATQTAIESEGFTLLGGNDVLPSTSAIWVYVSDAASSSRAGRVATPPSN